MFVNIEIGAFIDTDESHDWVEPLVGGTLRFDITKSFAWDAAVLDFSGFGFGSASDLTVNFYSGIDYRLSENYSLRLGYKMMSLDYARGLAAVGLVPLLLGAPLYLLSRGWGGRRD